MRYHTSFFKETLPEWKRKKDPILSKIFYRPVSFWMASVFANFGVKANTVSNISTLIGVCACVFMAIPYYWCGLAGGLLVNLWLILDCTDGNIARSVSAQPFGEFVDAVSSYLLVGLIFNVLGLRVYMLGGKIDLPPICFAILGAFTSSFDSLMRLVYQKYIVISRELGMEGKIALDGSNAGRIDRIRMRVEQEIGMGGILPLAILLGSIFNGLDIIIVLWCIYYGSVFVATTFFLLNKVKRYV